MAVASFLTKTTSELDLIEVTAPRGAMYVSRQSSHRVLAKQPKQPSSVAASKVLLDVQLVRLLSQAW